MNALFQRIDAKDVVRVREQLVKHLDSREYQLRIPVSRLDQSLQLIQRNNVFIHKSQNLVQDQDIAAVRTQHLPGKIQAVPDSHDLFLLFLR